MKIAWVLIFSIGLILRFYLIDLKPIHFDEGINGWFVRGIWGDGFYSYDPTNFHGPLLFYLLQISEALFGFGVESLRYVTSGFSVLAVLLIYLFRESLGKGAVFAGLLIAVSPAMTFFGRSAIHESTFVFAQMICFFGVLELSDARYRRGWNLFFAGLCSAVLIKETWVLSFLCGIATFCVLSLNSEFRKALGKHLVALGKQRSIIVRDFLFWLMPFLIISFEFGRGCSGMGRLFQAFMPWLKTGLSTGHTKPFFYWSDLIVQYEYGVALGFMSLLLLPLLKKNTRYLGTAIFSIFLFLLYSAIPYKTPWCSISFYWPFPILVALAIGHLEIKKIGWLLGAFATLAACFDAYSSVRLNYSNYASETHPYVYVQTTKEFGDFHRKVLKRFKEDPSFRNQPILVLMKDTWPLPYIFQRFTSLHFGMGSIKQPEIVITDEKNIEEIKHKWPEMKETRIRLRFAKEHSYIFTKKGWD